MNGVGTYHPMAQRHMPTRVGWVKVFGIGLLVGLGVCAGLWYLLRLPFRATDAPQAAMLHASQAPQMKPYPGGKAAVAPPETPPEDVIGQRFTKVEGRLDGLDKRVDGIDKKLDAMAKTKVAAKPKPPEAPKPRQPNPGLYLNTVKEEGKLPDTAEGPTYALMPGTWIPCHVESQIHSQIPSFFTAEVTTAVYDSATHKHVVIPQGAKIVAEDKTAKLLYGNERIPAYGVTLSIPGKKPVTLGDFPIADQLGQAGLTGAVDHHYWRNLAAMLTLGTLKGGGNLIQAEAAQAAGMGQVATGIMTVGNQMTQQYARQIIDTRPTITVPGAQQCALLLTKEVMLAAVYE